MRLVTVGRVATAVLGASLAHGSACRTTPPQPQAAPTAAPPDASEEANESPPPPATPATASVPLTLDEQLCHRWRRRDAECPGTPVGIASRASLGTLEGCLDAVAEERELGLTDDALVEAELVCLREPCDQLFTCAQPLILEQNARQQARWLFEALASDDPDRIMRQCSRAPESWRSICTPKLLDIYQARLEVAETALEQGTPSAVGCKDLFEPLNADGSQRLFEEAHFVCARLEAADAVAQAGAAKQRGDSVIPDACGDTMRRLGNHDAPWAETLRTEVIDACYGSLAVDVLRREHRNNDCSPELLAAYKAIRTHGIDAKGLARVMDKVRTRCRVVPPGTRTHRG